MRRADSYSGARGLYTAIIGALTGAVSAATAGQFSAALAPMAIQFGVSEEAVALTESVKSATVVIAMLVAPEIMRRSSWRFSFMLAALAMLIPQILIPAAESYPLLLALKALQGFSALLFPLILSLIMEWSNDRNMGLTTSVFMGVFYAGGSAGGTAAGVVISRWGWQSSFHALSAAMAVMGIIFLTTIKSARTAVAAEQGALSGSGGVYKSVVRRKETWFLIMAFLPTIWTIQAIWADVIPFGLSIGYTESGVGGTAAISAIAIVIASVLSGRASDYFALRVKPPHVGRMAVFSASMLLIMAGSLLIVFIDLAPPAKSAFNAAIFLLSFGAAWGLGSFYCILPEIFNEEQTITANGFVGGIADMAMPLSPMLMAILGIGMGRWDLSWLSCVAVSIAGLASAAKILRRKNTNTI